MNIENKLIEFNKTLDLKETNKKRKILDYNKLNDLKESLYTKKNILISFVFMSIYSLFSYIILNYIMNGSEVISLSEFVFIMVLTSNSFSFLFFYSNKESFKFLVNFFNKIKKSDKFFKYDLSSEILSFIFISLLVCFISFILFFLLFVCLIKIPLFELIFQNNFYDIINVLVCFSYSFFSFISYKKSRKISSFDNNEHKKEILAKNIKVKKTEIKEVSNELKKEILKSADSIFDFEYLELIIDEHKLFEVSKTMDEAKKEFANKNNKKSFDDIRKEILSEKYHSLPIENI